MKLSGGKAITLIILAIPGVVALAALSAMLNGWALTHLWRWFVVPFGIAPLGIAHAIGIAALVRYMTQTATETKSADAYVGLLLSPFFVLLFGYIVKSFM